jgi:TRAP-type C4-dicarboxylate transport system substrate-binding protein
MEEKSKSEMQKAGVEIINIDDKKPFQEAVQPVWEKYGKQQAELIKRIQDVK